MADAVLTYAQERAYSTDNAFHTRTMFNTRSQLLRKLWLAEQAREENPHG